MRPSSVARSGRTGFTRPRIGFPGPTAGGGGVEERDHLTRNEASADVFQCIEGFNNRRRLHPWAGHPAPKQQPAAFQAAASAV
ncbi:hypothetical protein GCM10009416_38260 [Craurococcus roseus]|uniref:Integrase catalytic domain-containing protein n=1 Tax=Craurococcus roseus TaxID=77585 RepID=A0ABP3QX84_9PROT